MIKREWKETIEKDAAAERERLAARFPGKKLLGVFGFLSPYKGIETAIHAMRYLPDEWHLLVYGLVHPSTIVPQARVSSYLASLLKMLEAKPGQLHRRVSFMGNVDDHRFLCTMRACDLVVFPYLEVGQSASGPASQAIEL
jgi:glycosyltransferase involved in cell wall biosynthesis